MIRIKTAGGCAWRGLYLSILKRPNRWIQLAAIIVDPDSGVRPKLIFLLPVGSFTNSCGEWPEQKRFEWELPRVPWRFPASPAYMALYRFSSRFWHQIDGRYGWFGSQRQGRRPA